MDEKHVKKHRLCRFLGGRQLGQRDEVHQLGKAIYNSQNGGVTFQGGQTGDNVQRDVRPGAMGHRQMMEDTRG